MEFDDLDVVGTESGLSIEFPGDFLDHVEADHLDVRLLSKHRRQVRAEFEADDLDCLGTEMRMFLEETLGDKNCRRRTIRSGTEQLEREGEGDEPALEEPNKVVDFAGVEDLFKREFLRELRLGVLSGMFVVLPGDLGEVLPLRAVLLHVLATGHSEELRHDGRGDQAVGVDRKSVV